MQDVLYPCMACIGILKRSNVVCLQAAKAQDILVKIFKVIEFVADTFTIVDQVVLVPTSYIMCALANDLVRDPNIVFL